MAKRKRKSAPPAIAPEPETGNYVSPLNVHLALQTRPFSPTPAVDYLEALNNLTRAHSLVTAAPLPKGWGDPKPVKPTWSKRGNPQPVRVRRDRQRALLRWRKAVLRWKQQRRETVKQIPAWLDVYMGWFNSERMMALSLMDRSILPTYQALATGAVPSAEPPHASIGYTANMVPSKRTKKART